MSPPRILRVFISSTFSDMQAEREQLMKHVFPVLRRLCEQRGAQWAEVDLRWGITDEQVAEGHLLPICLQEITRCRPCFIGLLGERYGSIPDGIPDEVLAAEPWLADYPGASITELEILHGALNDPAGATHAHFYFRDPAYLDTVPEGATASFQELPSPGDIERLGMAEATRRAQLRRNRLAALKGRIRSSGHPCFENYRDPSALGARVLEDFSSLIEREFPAPNGDPRNHDAAEHEAFAEGLAVGYVARRGHFQAIDAAIESPGHSLVIGGESGCGKSALLASWSLRHRVSHPSHWLFVHFIGSSEANSDCRLMLQRLYRELQRRCDVPPSAPGRSGAMRAALRDALGGAAKRAPVTIILDGLDRLQDESAIPLWWLPDPIPENVTFILSTAPGPCAQELARRGLPTLTLPALDAEERQTLIASYLGHYGKSLAPDLQLRIRDAPQTGSPLFLRVLLQELRMQAVHGTLQGNIREYLECPDLPSLYEKLFARWETDYEGESDLVGDTLSLIWASRGGISEAELLDVLTMGSAAPNRTRWASFFSVLSASLITVPSGFVFAHQQLGAAVADVYLPSEKGRLAVHLRLAEYYQSRDPYESVRAMRLYSADRLWQFTKAKSWPRLHGLLSNLEELDFLWFLFPGGVRQAWRELEANSDFRALETYRAVLESPPQHQRSCQPVSGLLHGLGYLQAALVLSEQVTAVARAQGLPRGVLLGFHNLPLVQRLSRIKVVAEEMGQPLGDPEKVANTIALEFSPLQQAGARRSLGDLPGAIQLYAKAASTAAEIPDLEGMAEAAGGTALALLDLGRSKEALAKLENQEEICRALGDRRGLAECLGNQALILLSYGDLGRALALRRQTEALFRDLGDERNLQICLGNQGVILEAQGEWVQALELFQAQEGICRQLGDLRSLAACLGNQATTLAELGQTSEAMDLNRAVEEAFRRLRDPKGLAITLASEASIFWRSGQGDMAWRLAREALSIASEHQLRSIADQIESLMSTMR